MVFSGNFFLSVLMAALTILVTGSYMAPALTMMQNSTDSSKTGVIVSIYALMGVIS
jgi:ferredoxin-NADP reductase